MSSQQNSSAIVEGSLPLLPGQRTWGPLALFGNSASAAVATWCFITGGYIAYWLPAGRGSIAITAGTLLGLFIMMLAAVPASSRYGIEAVRSTRPQFGVRGSNFALVLVLLIMAGWNAVLTIFLGRAAASALITMNVLPEAQRAAAEIGFGILGCLVVFILLRKGPDTLRNIGPVIAVSVIALSAVIMIILVTNVGLETIFAARPLEPYPSERLNYALVTELGIAGAVAWWPYVGGLTRFSKSTRGSILPVVLGLGVTMSLVIIIGLFASLAVPESGGDPTAFLIEVGGPVFGVVALGFIVLANIGTTMIGVYVCALALKQVPSIDRKVSWKGSTAISILPVLAILVFFAGPFMDNYGTFLAFAGVTLGPICGVQIADYYFIRKQHLDVRALFTEDRGGTYWYFGGVNPAGFIGAAAGVATYLLILDPVHFTARPGFEYMTATIPATIAAGASYWLAMRLIPGLWTRSAPQSQRLPVA
ncbi:cytosine permease [Arthrobacter mangrovi]|uniref:Cytosine/uracil/thiamine/allantoin permease n=1 Tax=Arthrobacter mangrovi TaxID=2966350 RepID=A0ABQ5MZJ5_9MICC|nr:cytosine permease [Arthrobacter mangrovi]GLB69122.1 cytosine/uracil/thiamine/allantoin permease [Arthrobacter mangrovi]